jgi:hypothetical protein
MGQLCGFDQIQEGYGSVCFTSLRVLGYMYLVFRVDVLLSQAIDAAMKASCTCQLVYEVVRMRLKTAR